VAFGPLASVLAQERIQVELSTGKVVDEVSKEEAELK